MRLPRTTVAGLLLAVAILAFDLAAVVQLRRGMPFPSGRRSLLLAILPTLNALMIGLCLLGHQLKVRREGAPFLVGFEAVGWLAVAAEFMVRLGSDDEMVSYEPWLQARLWSFWNDYIEWTGELTNYLGDTLAPAIQLIALTTPPLLLALCGGVTAACLGVRVDLKGASRARLRVIPARRALALVAVVALAVSAGITLRRGQAFARKAAEYARQEEMDRVIADSQDRATAYNKREAEWEEGRRAQGPIGEQQNHERAARALMQMAATAAEEAKYTREHAAFDEKLKNKYQRAAWFPWLPVEPDPPRPRRKR